MHLAGPVENGWRVVNVVPSRQESENFAREQLLPALRPQRTRRLRRGSSFALAAWSPFVEVRFSDGLRRTVDWYRDNPWWWEPIRSGDYRAYYERQYGRALG